MARPNRPMRRRAGIACAVVATAALAACGGSGGGGEGELFTIDAQMGWVLNSQYGSFQLADHEGYWEEEGLDVNLMPGGSNAIRGEQALAGGTADISTSDDLYSIVTAMQTGADIVVLGAVVQTNMSGIVSLASDPIDSLEDLSGRTIGIDPGAADRYRSAMAYEGLDPDSFDTIATSDANALVEGDVSGIGALAANQPVQLDKLGYEPHWLSAESLGFPDYNEYIITTSTYLEENREEVVGFIRGLVRGAQLAVADPDLVAEVSVEIYGADLGQDPEAARLEAAVMAENMVSDYTDSHGLLWIDPDKLGGPITDSLLNLYGLDSVPPVADIYDDSILTEAYDGATSLEN
jgi:ABC-type nitrate/sulfonate/bicarbonate transport system substrate-binding protein